MSSASRARRRSTSTSRSTNSSISFVPVRHEQGGAYMADMYGRLTGRAGVCLGTLGPGATNLVTAVADAYLDRAPLVALTGQGDMERMHKESHQYLDIVETHAADHEVERPRQRPGDHPRGRPQGVQGRRVREAGRDAPRAARGRHGRAARRRAAAAPAPRDPRARRPRAAARRRHHPQRDQPDRRWPATASSAPAPRRRCASSPARPASRSPRRSWARAPSTTPTRARSAPSASSRATTRWRASRTPTS